MKKGKLFIREVIARLKGDDAEVLASKIARKALVALESQIAALRSKEVDLESAVEDKQEALANAKFPTEQITNSQVYVQGISNAQNRLDSAKQDLEDVKESIKYFEGLLNEF